jgi:hypothetical protein
MQGAQQAWDSASFDDDLAFVGLFTPLLKEDWQIDDFVLNLVTFLVTEKALLERGAMKRDALAMFQLRDR